MWVIEASEMKKKTNFDRYLEEQLKDKDFAERFRKAGEAWDVALKLSLNPALDIERNKIRR